MTGQDVVDNNKPNKLNNPKGYGRYFSCRTNLGRANVSYNNTTGVASRLHKRDVRNSFTLPIFLSFESHWVSIIGLIVAYKMLKPKKTPAKQQKLQPISD